MNEEKNIKKIIVKTKEGTESKTVPFERHYFDCVCKSEEHLVSFSLYNEDGIKELYLTTHLSQENNIFQRAWLAVKYIFGYRSRYGNFGTWVLAEEDVDELMELLTKYKIKV